MADQVLKETDAGAASVPPVVVKKYANRRLYNTESSSYITLENLADMVRGGRDFVVYDAKSGDDMVAYFGYPVAQENAAERAVRAGLAIVEAMGPLVARARREHGVGGRRHHARGITHRAPADHPPPR